MTGMVFDIQKFSIHDGPGIRTTVFLKGCPLNCRWCHNPESISPDPQLSFTPDRCIGCGYCFERCPSHAHQIRAEQHIIARDTCTVCGVCTETCFAEALEIVGSEMTVAEVIEEVLKDKPFYETSGGGMTLSGGEPLMQIEFTTELLKCAKEQKNLHCCLETCGFSAPHNVERLRPYVDIFLYDIKETDSARHRELTGVPNERILANLQMLHDVGERITVRLPLIPGLNDSEEHFRGIADLAKRIPNVDGFEVMPYHRLGEGKLDRLGQKTTCRFEGESPSDETIHNWLDRLQTLGVPTINERD